MTPQDHFGFGAIFMPFFIGKYGGV